MTCQTCEGQGKVPNGPAFPGVMCPACAGSGLSPREEDPEKTSPDLYGEGPIFPARVLWAVTLASAAWIAVQVGYGVSVEKRIERLEERCPTTEKGR
jgi:hypothetical protein